MDPVIAFSLDSIIDTLETIRQIDPKPLEVLGAMGMSFFLNMLVGLLY